MTVQLSSLRVTPDLDAGKYTAGANAKVAADKAMAASSREAGAASVDTSAKLSQSGDVLARLSRQYVDGYAAQQRFEQGLRHLNRGLETGKIGMEGAERILIGMNQRLGLTADVAQLAAKGQNELAAAVGRANAQIARQAAELATADAANRRLQGANSNGISAGAGKAAAFNAGQQIQDIAMMSLVGQAPMMLALQQGPQLATAIQQGGGIAALGAGLASVFSATTLVTVGIVAATAATVQWFAKGKDGANGMTAALDKSGKAVRELADAYKLAGFNADELGRKTIIAAEAEERISRRELERQIRQSGRDIQSATTPSDFMTFGMLGGGQEHVVDPRFSAFAAPILELRKALAGGKADFATLESIQHDIEAIADQGYSPFRTFVDDMARMVGMEPEGIRETADILQSIITKAAEAARRLEQLQNLNKDGRGGRVVGPNRMDAAQESGRRILEEQRREREFTLANEEARFQARLDQMRARTNAEKLAAAERTARAEGGEINEEIRVRRALAEERMRQDVEARDAAIQRSQAIERTLEQQRHELDLIGKTASEQTKLRFEFERMQELREQAARTGEPIDQKGVANIEAAAAAMGRYADATARAQLADDLQFERRQIFRSPEDQDAAGRLRSMGLPDDMNSYEAGLIKANQQLERMKDAWEDIFDTARDGIDGVVDALFEGGSISDALKNAGRQLARTLFDQAITNPLKNWLTGSSLNSIADLGIFGSGASSGKGGGFGGVLGNLLGAQKAVASMQVQAATVLINGSPLGGIPGVPGSGSLTSLFGGPNTPETANKLLGGLGSPLGAANANIDTGITGSIAKMASGSGVQSQVWNFFAGKGLAPHQIAGIMGNVGAESAFNPLAIGDGGSAFGLFQHNDRSAGLFGALGGRGNLGDVQGQLNFAWKELQTTESRAMQALLSSKDVRGATSAFAGFERPSGFSWGNPEGAHNFTGRLAGAEEALAKFGDSAGTATSAIATLGSSGIQVSQSLVDAAGGLTNFGGMLSSFMASSTGGGSSWFQGLMGMFGGVGGALGHMNSISPKATAHILGGFGGLFANGAAFSGGNVTPFAKGDVFSSPMHFPMSGGRTGLMGEAGPEAIMPLKRGADGRLGIAAGSSQQGGMGNVESIVNAIAKKLSFNVKNVNVLDPAVVGDYLRTEEGERLVMNIQRRNG